ncbi:MAG TPA: hypothetical protein EYQ73_07820 [Candidatus Poseidoniales archaeon]|nr:hypothetical protein [Candidatus Poseidoniales archaeon]
MTGTTMVGIQCPHCEKAIELEDGAFGLFDCPYCDEEFSWGSGTPTLPIEQELEFWFGLLTPCLILLTSLWIMIAIYDPSGYEGLAYVFLSIVFCISSAIILGVYGWLKKRKPLAIGAVLSPIVSAISFYIYAENGI